MNVFRHVGYFVDLTLGPVERREWVFDDIFSVSYRTTLLGVMGVGVFAEGFLGPYGFAYGAGYGMAGDGRNAIELFLHRATVRRRFRRLDVSPPKSLKTRITWFSDAGAGGAILARRRYSISIT